MVKKIIICFISGLFVVPALAHDCDKYKKDIEIKLNKAEWGFDISASDHDLWPVGGYVKIQPFSMFAPKIGYVFNGKYYCVYLDSIETTVGFQDFHIVIDKKYKPESCEYNAVLEHEKHHISDSEAAFDKIYPKLEAALQDAVKDVEPVYVSDADNVPYAIEDMQNKIKNNKKLKELVDEFNELSSHDAAVLDGTPDENLIKCEEEKIKSAFEKFYKKKK